MIRALATILLQAGVLGYAFQAEGPVQVVRKPARPASAVTERASPMLRVDSSMVLIPVRVTTAAGSTVNGLRKEDFALFEDGVPQNITYFAEDDAPVSVGVLLDISGSMKDKMRKSAQAAAALFRYANPEDEFCLIEFNWQAKLTVPFTRDWSLVARAIGRAKASGYTALLDAIHLGLKQMKRAANSRKALIVMSDGGDNFSRRNLRQLKAALIEADVQLYSLGVYDSDFAAKRTKEERQGPALLSNVTADSGGCDFPLVRMEQLPEVSVQIARDLRNEYVLGYAPPALISDGKYHRIGLKLAAPEGDGNWRTYYRQGYYAPVE